MIASSRRAFARTIIAAFLIPASLASANAHEFTLGALKIGHPWGRATPPGAKVAGGYLTVLNTGSEPDRLLGGTVEIASRVELHEMSVTDGIMRMRELPRGLEILPGQKIELKPGSYHLMWMDISRPPKQGDRVKGILRFERAGDIMVEFQIDAIGSSGGDHKGHEGG